MFVQKSINSEHTDLIHDIAYDFYGKRMATCSSDQMVKVWDLKENGDWKSTARWRNHSGPVWRVDWAHPEFGQVIATCSFDRTIEIWEEVGSPPKTMLETPSNNVENELPSASNTNWIKRATLVDPRTSVVDIQFAPRHMGLQLAAISSDGFLRIYEAEDVMNLSQWTLQFDFSTKMIGSCISWSYSRLDVPLIAVGSNASEFLEKNSASSTQHHLDNSTFQPQGPGRLALCEYVENQRQWNIVENVKCVNTAVFDVSFAPHLGQSFQILAVATENEVLILRITCKEPLKDDDGNQNQIKVSQKIHYQIQKIASFDHHKGRVWRLSWNITGSLLASSGEDGFVRLWQSNYLDNWRCVGVISNSGQQFIPSKGLPNNQECIDSRNAGNLYPYRGIS